MRDNYGVYIDGENPLGNKKQLAVETSLKRTRLLFLRAVEP